MKKIKLFCLPYAGGSAAAYSSWKDHLDSRIQLYPLEIAGRGRRISEPNYNSVDEAAEDIIGMIKYDILDAPYAFYGHSLGAITAYHTVQKIMELKYPQPVHMFFSGRGAPHIRRDDKKPYHLLPDDEFREKILDLGGTPNEFFEYPELMEILLPLLKTDFRNSWNFKYTEEMKPLNCDISVLTGEEEDLNPDQIDQWKQHTKYKCNYYSFEGGHFFLNTQSEKEKIMKILNTVLVDLAGRWMRIA